MYPPILFFLSIFVLVSSNSCSSIERCSQDKIYSIEYSSGGGITGEITGKTIDCSGRVLFWKKQPNSALNISDSLNLSDDQIETINSIITNPELMDYKSGYVGNYTTYLSITLNSVTNRISFNKSDPPGDFPAVIKNLIGELNKIKK